MPLPGQKMYVITKPDLIQLVQKQHKILAFPPIQAKFTVNLCGPSEKTAAAVMKNANGEEGPRDSLVMDSHDAIGNGLRPGDAIDSMNRIMLREVGEALNELQPPAEKTCKIELNTWLRNTVTTATTRSVYGPLNPYDDKAVADAFWSEFHLENT